MIKNITIAALLTVVLGLGTAQASGKGHHKHNHINITNEYVTNEYVTNEHITNEEITNKYLTINEEENFITESDLYSGMASLAAFSAIDFSNTTDKLQVGVGIGGYQGRERLALGFGKMLGDNALFTFKGSRIKDHTMYAGSLIFKLK